MELVHIRELPYRLDRHGRFINRDAPTRCGANPLPLDTDLEGAQLVIENFLHLRFVAPDVTRTWVEPLCPACLAAIGYTKVTRPVPPKPEPPALRDVVEPSKVELWVLAVCIPAAGVLGYMVMRWFA